MMTGLSDIEQRIQTVLHGRLQIDAPALDEDLFEAGILDSLSFVDMLVALEREFSIQIPLDQVDLNDFRSISRIATYVASGSRSSHGEPLGSHSML